MSEPESLKDGPHANGLSPPSTSSESSPAPGGAGGFSAKGREEQLLELTCVTTRLEVLYTMYLKLLKIGVGMRKIESESWSIVWERMCGPTGHPSLLEGFESEHNQSGIEPEVIVNAKSIQCWRDVKLVKELVSVRINVLKTQWKLSKEKHGLCARILASILPNLEMKKLWSRVDQVRRETWMEEHSLKQRKTEHLLKVSRDCSKHSMCKKLNQLTTDRLRTWVTGRGPGTSSADPPSPKLSSHCERVSQLPSVKPNLRPVFMDKTVDLSQIRMEEEQLLAMVYDFNDNLVTEGNVPENEVVVTYGCNLTDDELSLLNLGPGFVVASTLDPEEMEVESVVTLTKIRWGRRSKGQETMTNEEIAKEEMEIPENEYQESLTEAMEIAARDVIEEEKMSVNMRKKRATDMRNNRNVFMPGPGPAKVESSHTVRMWVWTETFNEYRRRHCDDKGGPLKKNLTIGQQIALKSLGRKIARLELLVLEADKGKRFVLTTEKTYKAMASDHVAKDKMASICEIRSCQRVLSCTAKAMVNMFGTGMDQGWRNYSRCFDNAGSEAEDAPVLKILPKVHKPPMAAGHPASRPVVAAATGISSRAGDILADFLEPLVLLGTPRQEDQSTEEVLSQLEDAQAAIKASGSRNTMVGSLDVKALYPSLDQDAAAEVVAQLVYESEVRFNGINWRCVQTFLASNHTQEELKQQGIAHLIPDRVFSLVRRPGPTTPELSMKIPQDKEMPPYSKWKSTDIRTLTSQQKKILLSRAVKTAVKVIFKNHVYQFGGVYYLQVSGGPIGLRLTSVVARIVMDRWSLLFLAKLDNSGWQLWAMMKYVDDVNLVLEMMDTNVVWEGEGQQKLVSIDKVERQGDEEETTKEDHTMSLVQKAANSVFSWLEFMADLPSDHSSQMVPMLDLQVWVNHHRRFCYDKSCVTCRSRSWLQEQTKAAKKAKEKLPDELEKTTVNQCRREGINYTIQCLTCIPLGLKTLYRGEGARSARQRQGEHFRDLENGTVASPLVIHALEDHGGQKPEMLAVVDKLEPSALYRAARESVKISKLPQGPTNMNHCQEWGAPRVPVVSVMGRGDEPEGGDDGEAGVV